MTVVNRRGLAIVAIFGVMAAGCLVKDERHTWYLDPVSGAVTWKAFEHDVRSDSTDPKARLTEESQFWTAVQADAHDMARGFRALGGSNVRTRVLRDAVPYSVVTEASWPAIDEIGRRVIAAAGVIGTSSLGRDGDARIWTMTLRCPKDGEPEPEISDDVMEVLDVVETLRVVLPRGRFESVVGFNLDDDRRVAVIDKTIFENFDDGAEVVLRLRWIMEP